MCGFVLHSTGGGKTSGVCSFVRRTRKIHGSTKYVIESRSTWKKTTGNNSGKNNSGLWSANQSSQTSMLIEAIIVMKRVDALNPAVLLQCNPFPDLGMLVKNGMLSPGLCLSFQQRGYLPSPHSHECSSSSSKLLCGRRVLRCASKLANYHNTVEVAGKKGLKLEQLR